MPTYVVHLCSMNIKKQPYKTQLFFLVSKLRKKLIVLHNDVYMCNHPLEGNHPTTYYLEVCLVLGSLPDKSDCDLGTKNFIGHSAFLVKQRTYHLMAQVA